MAIRLPDPADRSLPPPVTIAICPMRRRHIRSVLRIEQQVYPRPWSYSLFMSELALRTGRAYSVATAGSAVVGFTGMMFTGDDAHVTTMAVDPLWHRRSVGTRLMLHNCRVALEHGACHLTLEVRVSNQAAQGLYRKFGFRPAGVRKNYYAEVNEDALVMWADDIDTELYAERLAAIEAGIPGATVTEVRGS